MSTYISVVSHGHGDLIKKLSCLSELSKLFTVVVKLNKPEEAFTQYLKNNNIEYIDESALYGLGFGHNNNIVFNYCKDQLSMKKNDYFLVFNPDVVSDVNTIKYLVSSMIEKNILISGVNLFKNDSYTIPDNSVRKFPTLIQFIKSFLGFKNKTIIDKSLINKNEQVDWVAGSFIGFKTSYYEELRGFDEKYFMYCEDVDICFRSKLLGNPVTFFPDVKMQHLAQHANRKLFSKHFYWHVTSVMRFLLTNKKLTSMRSSIN